MKETHKARQAFEDYYNMGPNRSIRKLCQLYIDDGSEKKIPTRHIATLLKWSQVHGWQDRCKERDEEIAQATMDELKATATKTGYALYYKRIADLGTLADKLLERMGFLGGLKPSMIREFRGLLADIASEMGERQKRIELDLGKELLELMAELGLTYDDIRGDGVASQLFVEAGLPTSIG